MGTGGHVTPQYLWRGTSTVMSPQYFRSDVVYAIGLFYPVTATTVVCCILMQILCVVSQKKLQFLVYPRLPTGAPPLNPAGDIRPLDPQSSFMSPPIILWDRHPCSRLPYDDDFFITYSAALSNKHNGDTSPQHTAYYTYALQNRNWHSILDIVAVPCHIHYTNNYKQCTGLTVASNNNHLMAFISGTTWVIRVPER